jgi:hypothetical protein
MIAKIVETILIIVFLLGTAATIHPSQQRLNLSMSALSFMCGAAVCYLWL